MKKIMYYLAGLLFICALATLTTCTPDRKEEPAVVTPDRPEAFVLYDAGQDTILASLQFSEEGLPSAVGLGDLILLFSNFHENRFNLTVLQNGEHVLQNESIETTTDWDRYRIETTSSANLRSSISNVKKITSSVSALLCGISVVIMDKAESNRQIISAVLTKTGCDAAIITFVDAYFGDEQTDILVQAAEWAGTISTCASVFFTLLCINVAACLADLATRSYIAYSNLMVQLE